MNVTTTQQPILSYSDVFEIVSLYCPKVQPLFADGWRRFPQGEARDIVIDALDDAAEFYTRSPIESAGEKYLRCKQAADTVRHYNA